MELLRRQDPLRIEAVSVPYKSTFILLLYLPIQLLNRRPPFGLEIITAARELPSFSLEINEVAIKSSGGGPVEVTLSIECGLTTEEAVAPKGKKPKGRTLQVTAVLTLTSDNEFIDFRRIQ